MTLATKKRANACWMLLALPDSSLGFTVGGQKKPQRDSSKGSNSVPLPTT